MAESFSGDVWVITSSPGPGSGVGMLDWRLHERDVPAAVAHYEKVSSPGDEIVVRTVTLPDTPFESVDDVTEYLAATVDY